MRLKGKIVNWQSEKGFGFIEPMNGAPNLFFHGNFLFNQSRRPVIGDEVSFEVTTNREGKQKAVRILFRGERNLRKVDIFFDVFYSILSCMFLTCIGALVFLEKIDVTVLIIYLFLSLFTFLLYWRDKIKAKKDEWRIPENRLHFFSLIGGWPGALVAQRWLHHKSRKQSFLVVFYCTVILNISAMSFWCYQGTNFLNYDFSLQKLNKITQEFSKEPQGKSKSKGPVYSWTNKEGETVYSNFGFPADEACRNKKIEWE